jgi:hypothetical protein
MHTDYPKTIWIMSIAVVFMELGWFSIGALALVKYTNKCLPYPIPLHKTIIIPEVQ